MPRIRDPRRQNIARGVGFRCARVRYRQDGNVDRFENPALARLRPLVADRRQLLIADGMALVEAGFPLLPTLEAPHWTVVLAAATATQFERVRTHFNGPIDNPAYRRPTGDR